MPPTPLFLPLFDPFISSAMYLGDEGGANVYAPPGADPTTGFFYVSYAKNYSWQPAFSDEEADALIAEPTKILNFSTKCIMPA